MPSTGSYLLIGAVACLVTFIATPLVRRLAEHFGWLYLPSERTVHTRPMPAIGGLAMFAGFIVAFAVSRLLDTFDQLYARNSEPRGIILAASIIVAAGLYDDIKGASPPAKVTATVLRSSPFTVRTVGAPARLASQPPTRLPSGIPPRNATM